MISRRSDSAALALACLIAMATSWCAWRLATSVSGLDYYAFWETVRFSRETASKANGIYGPTNQRRLGLAAERTVASARTGVRQTEAASSNLRLYEGRIETLATPFFYAVVSILMIGEYERDIYVFVGASLAAHAIGVALLGRMLRYSATLTAWGIGALGLPFLPFCSNLSVLNVGALQLLQVAGTLMLISSRALASAGCLLGLAIAFKPTLLPILPAIALVLTIDGHRGLAARLLVGLAFGLGIACLTGCGFLQDWSCWYQWLGSLSAVVSSESVMMSPWNCSMSSYARASLGIDISGMVMAGLLGCMAFFAHRSRFTGLPETPCAGRAPERLVLAGSMGCVIALVGSPLVWGHYQLLTIPLLLWVGRRSMAGGDHTVYRSLAVLAFLLLTVAAQAMGLGRQMTEMVLGNVASLILLALGFHDLLAGSSLHGDAHSE